MLLSFIVLETNSSSLGKNPQMSLWSILAVSGEFLAKETWVWTALYHSSTDLFPCWKPCEKMKPSPHFIWLRLAETLQTSPKLYQALALHWTSSRETYWSMLKSPLQAITFLHWLFSGNIPSSHSRMFSHFKWHLMNLWYRPYFTVQSILRPSMVGAWTSLGTTCASHGWGKTSGSCSWSELEDSSCALDFFLNVFPLCLEEVSVVLGILGVCTLC